MIINLFSTNLPITGVPAYMKGFYKEEKPDVLFHQVVGTLGDHMSKKKNLTDGYFWKVFDKVKSLFPDHSCTPLL